jgi:hypothetical protein
VVYRPADPQRFSGVVAVEWLNVSAGFDMCPDWLYMHRELTRTGAAWIGVSAQKIGIDGGQTAFGAPRHLKVADPARYAGLLHPGDAFAYDIFSAAGRLARHPRFFGATPRTVIATGHSQSAAYLVTYINAIDPTDRLFDGFLVHGRPGAVGGFDGGNVLQRLGKQANIRIRADVRVPVITLQAETDVIGSLLSVASRQPDGENFRLWEVAGAAHGDNYVAQAGAADSGLLPPDQLAQLLAPARQLLGLTLAAPANCGPQIHYVQNAAFNALLRWVTAGDAPPHAPVLEVETVAPPAFRLDSNGNALGGVRTPWVDVPTAIHSGLPQDASPLSALFGSSQFFPVSVLQKLYPGGRAEYRRRFDAALDDAINAGFMLAADRAENVAISDALFPGEPG